MLKHFYYYYCIIVEYAVKRPMTGFYANTNTQRSVVVDGKIYNIFLHKKYITYYNLSIKQDDF